MRRAAAALVLAAQAVTVTDAVPAAPRRGLQRAMPLLVGSFCRRKCNDGSEPTIDRAADCPAGTLCQSPASVVAGCVDPLTGGGCGTCGLRAYVCREQISASCCNVDVFKKTFCPQLAGASGMASMGYDMNAYACAHDPSGAGGILRGMPGVGRTSEMYSCYTALVSANAFDGMATFEAFCPAECDPNHDAVAPSGPALPTPAPTKQGSRCDELRQTALDEETTGMVGEEVANCDEQGDFMPVQCNGSIGSCWCVDSATGVEVPGTMRMCRGPTCGVTIESCLNGGRPEAPPLSLGCCTSMAQRNCVPCGALAPPPPTYHPTPPPPPGKGHCAAGTQYCAALGYCSPVVLGMNCEL